MPFEQRVGGPELGEDLARRSSSAAAIRAWAHAPSTPDRKSRLRLRKAAPIEPRNSGAAVPRPSVPALSGVTDETDWMGDRLGRGRAYTCSRADASERARPECRPPPTDDSATPPAGYRAEPRQARCGAAGRRSFRARVGHALPTPGIGQPDGRKGIQQQVTPIGQEALGFHDYWLLPLCAIISIFVLALLLYAIVRFRRSANPTPSRNSHNTVIEVIWTLVPVLILVGDRDPVDPAAAAPLYAAARRPDGQGHRPPMVLVLRAARLWRAASTATC